jgi:pimeloyl-ACP methyl ester carboxylesterase
VDLVGSSLGARLVLEMARRGRAGSVVALDPGGFWVGWERTYLQTTLLASLGMLRLLRPGLRFLSHSVVPRTALLMQLSDRPWALDGDLVEKELESYLSTPTFVDLVNDLAAAPMQQGPAAPETGAVTIGWGRQDRLCLPVQAWRAQAAFPGSRLHWFEGCGHYPAWDRASETVRLIRETLQAPRSGG